MDRVQIGALLLAGILLLGWLMTLPDAPPVGPPASPPEPEFAHSPTAPRDSFPASPLVPASPEPAPPAPDLTQARTVMLQNDAVRLEISNLGGRVVSLELLDFRDRVDPPTNPVQLVTIPARGAFHGLLGEGIFEEMGRAAAEIEEEGSRRVSFRVDRGGVTLRRTLTLDDVGYGGRLELAVVNRSDAPVRPLFEVAIYGEERHAEAPDRFQNYQLVVSADGELERVGLRGIGSPGFFGSLFGGNGAANGSPTAAPVEWAGVESQYFLLAALPENAQESEAFQGPIGRDSGVSMLRYRPVEVPAGTRVERVYRLYFGPKVLESVIAVDPRLEPSVRVGWSFVRPIVDLFASMLVWTHDHLVENYGVAIILLTILLRLATYPLTQRSMKSMRKFSLIAPEMKAIQEKYADDKTLLQEEMMKMYKRKGMNPLAAMGGGCLPMLIQMPFMIALYFALQSTIELRHAPFIFWINDLSSPEQLFSIAGLPIRVLPLLMGGSMLLQQWLAPATGDSQQRQTMMMMNVVFIFMFYQFPSGLVLYWFVSNLLGILQQLLVNRDVPGPPAAAKA